jgi:predicted nucleotidyltransferase
VRISSASADKAVNIIVNHFGGDVPVWLFGSRVSDAKRGGDVDIYVETQSPDFMKKIHCQSQLVDLFDMDVDLVVGNGSKPIHRIAKETGVRLK